MTDSSILTPGYQDTSDIQPEAPQSPNYLLRDNFLSEYTNEEERSVVRENLNVPSKDSVYNRQDVDSQISEKIREAIQEYLNADDPHGIIPIVEGMIKDMVKTDGSTPFVLPQVGVDPQVDNHLTTKKYVDKQLRNHLNQEDPHNTLQAVEILLQPYVKQTEVFDKSQLYTKKEVDEQAKDYIRRDGTTSFTKAQLGVDPQIDGHLATKRYVDKTLYNHLVSIDPHGFISILNNRLAQYAKKQNVLDKSETYSRTQIDTIINKLVSQSIQIYLGDYYDTFNDKIQDIYKQNYVKKDGTIPFTAPQEGVSAQLDSHLTTLKQVTDIVQSAKDNLQEQLNQSVWTTSGDIKTTVGFMEDNTPVPQTMTLQELADAIFYGKRISIEVPKYVIISDTCKIKVCIHGDAALMLYAEIYQDETLIHTIDKDQLVNGCTVLQSNPISSDTEFILKVYYSNGTVAQEEAFVLCTKPLFVGLLPKFKSAYTVTMDYLKELVNQDFEGTQNRFVNQGKDLAQLTFNYSFEDPQLRHPFIVIPKDYPNLEQMVTPTQSFGIDAFDVINDIPLEVEGQSVIYKIYVYKQALVSLNSSITFKFITNESVQ